MSKGDDNLLDTVESPIKNGERSPDVHLVMNRQGHMRWLL
jgi:hypothetical protein